MKHQTGLPGLFAPFSWVDFGKKISALRNGGGHSSAVAGESGLRVVLFAACQLGWILDDTFKRSWRKAELRDPLFILGHPRSGTTFLHRMLVEDYLPSARSFTFFESLFPSMVWWSVGRRVRHLQHGRFDWIWGCIDDLQQRMFRRFDHIHQLRFEELEEDEYLFWLVFASSFCVFDSPAALTSKELAHMNWPEASSKEQTSRFMQWYRACLKKKMSGASPDTLLVAKNTAGAKRLAALIDEFPNAKFIYLLRNPMEAIPSRLSLIESIWRERDRRFTGLSTSEIEIIVEDCVKIYRTYSEELSKLPNHSVEVLIYKDLVRDPEEAIAAIAAKFRLGGPRPDFAGSLARRLAQRSASTGRRHVYSLEQYGLNESELRQRLSFVYEGYQVE